MRQKLPLKDISKEHILNWISSLREIPVCVFNSNQFADKFVLLIGIGQIDNFEPKSNSFTELKSYYEKRKDWILGYLSYDLKNETEELESNNYDGLGFPQIHFFCPKLLFVFKKEESYLLVHEETRREAQETINNILKHNKTGNFSPSSVHLKSRINKKEYISIIEKLKSHIHKGDIYEINFCQEYFSTDYSINPFEVYLKLNNLSPTPFSCYYAIKEHYLMCASPERFLQKTGNKIISQPIKGTIKRGESEEEDTILKQQLKADPKERAENIMIVDLVRNDLSRTALKGSVKVDELFGIYSFKTVHQMISTISSQLRKDVHFIDAIKHTFPMGSMTGAPKIKAMELIEKYESTKRGVFSGAVGYISPDGDFDFNVVIRSITYNQERKYLSFMVGSAITANCIPENEYEECLLKAKTMIKALSI